jgi:hypothetical protein
MSSSGSKTTEKTVKLTDWYFVADYLRGTATIGLFVVGFRKVKGAGGKQRTVTSYIAERLGARRFVTRTGTRAYELVGDALHRPQYTEDREKDIKPLEDIADPDDAVDRLCEALRAEGGKIPENWEALLARAADDVYDAQWAEFREGSRELTESIVKKIRTGNRLWRVVYGCMLQAHCVSSFLLNQQHAHGRAVVTPQDVWNATVRVLARIHPAWEAISVRDITLAFVHLYRDDYIQTFAQKGVGARLDALCDHEDFPHLKTPEVQRELDSFSDVEFALVDRTADALDGSGAGENRGKFSNLQQIVDDFAAENGLRIDSHVALAGITIMHVYFSIFMNMGCEQINFIGAEQVQRGLQAAGIGENNVGEYRSFVTDERIAKRGMIVNDGKKVPETYSSCIDSLVPELLHMEKLPNKFTKKQLSTFHRFIVIKRWEAKDGVERGLAYKYQHSKQPCFLVSSCEGFVQKVEATGAVKMSKLTMPISKIRDTVLQLTIDDVLNL